MMFLPTEHESSAKITLVAERLGFSLMLFLTLWCISLCWRSAQRNQRLSLSDSYEYQRLHSLTGRSGRYASDYVPMNGVS